MDQCTHCTMRGDLELCFATECGQHESWLVKELRRMLEASNKPQRYGCHCDELDPGIGPDGCVIDENRSDDCVYARRLFAEGKGRNDCKEWRPVSTTHLLS